MSSTRRRADPNGDRVDILVKDAASTGPLVAHHSFSSIAMSS
jgi:hypothetical protein